MKLSDEFVTSFELVYHQMIEHGICGRCNDEPNEKNHHMKVQHQSRIQELTIIQNERRKPGPKSRQITRTMNSEGESEEDEEAFETSDIETVIDSDDNEDQVPIQAANKRANKQNTVPPIKPGPKSRQIAAMNMTAGPLSMKRHSLPLTKVRNNMCFFGGFLYKNNCKKFLGLGSNYLFIFFNMIARRILTLSNGHEGGHFPPSCPYWISLRQLNFYQKFLKYFGGKN